MNTLDLDVKARDLAEGLGLLDAQGALNPEGLRALAAGDAVALGEALDALLTLLPEDEDLGARLLALPEPPGLHLALAADAETPGQYSLGLALTPEGAALDAAPETSLRLALWLFRLTPGEALVDQQRAQATLSLPMKDGPFAALGLTARHDAEDTALELTLRPRDEDAAPLHIVYPPPPGEGSDAERLALSALPEALKLITLAIPDGPAQAALEALLALVGWLPSARRDGAEAPTTLTLPTLDLAALVADPGAALGAWAGQLIDGEGADARGRRAVALAASVLAMGARDGAALPVTGAEERAAWCATLTEDDAPLALRLELRQLQAGDGPPRLRLGLRVSWGLDLAGGADDQVSASLTALARAELLEITLSERPETRLLPEAELGVELVGVGVGEDGAPRPIVTLAEPELRAGRLRVGLRVDASGALAPDVALYDLRSPALTVDRFDLTSEDNLLLLGAAAAGGGLVALLRWLIGPSLFTVAEDAVALFSPLAPVVGAVAVGGVDPVDFGALGPDLGALDRLYGDWMRRLLADEAAFSEWSAAVDAALATWARAVAGEDEEGADAEVPAAPPPKTAWSFGPALARVVTEDGPRLEAALMLERRGPLSTGTRRAQLLLGVLDALAFTDAARPVGVRWLPRVGAALRFQAPADAPARLSLSGGATPLTVEAAELALLLGVDRDGVTTADTTLSGLTLRQGDAVLAAPERISFASFSELADEAAPRALSLIFASALGPVHDGAARRALALAALFGFTSDSPAWTPLTPPAFKELWADPTRRLPRLLARRLEETAWSGAPGEAPAAALFGSFLRGEFDLSAAPGPVHGAGRPSAPWVVPLLQPGGQTVEALLWIGPEGPALPEAAEDRAAWVERALPSAPGSVEALAQRAVAAGPWLDEAAREGLARLGEGGLVALLGALDGALATSAERPELLTTLRAATANLTGPWALLVGPELDEEARARLALALGVEGEWILSLPLNDGGGPLDRAEAAAWVRAELSLLGGPTLVALGAAAAVARAVDPRAKVVPGGSLEALDAARRLWALGLADDEDTGWQARALRGLAALADAVCAPGATGSWPHDGAAMAGDAGIAAPDAAGLAAAWLNEALRARLQAALETPRAAPTGLGVGLRLRGEAVEGALRGTITAELSLGELDLADGADGARALSAGGFVRAACLLESPGAWVVGDGRSATRLRAVEARITLLPAPEASARLIDGAWGGMSAGASLDDLGVALLGEAELGSREGAATALVAAALPLALAGAGGLSASDGAALWTTALGALMTGLGAS
ncbi:hypothetical protein L6R49_27070, partial [Myxococcota bacterium]|nr:hypothetical protein [Myxococcota bacterium]